MREQLERDGQRLKDEYDSKLRKIELAKQKLEEEAMWLHRQQQQKRSSWEKDLQIRDEEIRLLHDDNERQKLELNAQEIMLKERMAELGKRNKETVGNLRRKIRELVKREPAGPVSPLPGGQTGVDLQEILDGETKGIGVSTRDLIFGIAHQIRNPLAIIKTHANYCLEKFKFKGRDREPLLAIVRGVENLGERLEDVLDLTRRAR